MTKLANEIMHLRTSKSRCIPTQLRLCSLFPNNNQFMISVISNLLLKTVAFIAGKSENPADQNLFIHFSWITLIFIYHVGLNWILDAISPLKSFSSIKTCLFDVNCKIWQTQQSHFSAILLLVRRNRDAIATSDFSSLNWISIK